jgi:hypothetical protein
MESYLSSKDIRWRDGYASLSNSEKVIRAIGKLGRGIKNKIAKESGMRIQRVNETIAILEKSGYVYVTGQKKKTKNHVPSNVYGLTFRGVLSYLDTLVFIDESAGETIRCSKQSGVAEIALRKAIEEQRIRFGFDKRTKDYKRETTKNAPTKGLIKLEQPIRIGKPNEPIDEFYQRIKESNQNYIEQREKVIKVIQTVNKEVNFPIFNEIDWLLHNYIGHPNTDRECCYSIIDTIVKVIKEQHTNSSILFKNVEEAVKKEKALLKEINERERDPSLQKGKIETDKNGVMEVVIIDFLEDAKEELRDQKEQIKFLVEYENESLKHLFECAFLDELACLKKKTAETNETLLKMAKDKLESKNIALENLKITIENLEKSSTYLAEHEKDIRTMFNEKFLTEHSKFQAQMKEAQDFDDTRKAVDNFFKKLDGQTRDPLENSALLLHKILCNLSYKDERASDYCCTIILNGKVCMIPQGELDKVLPGAWNTLNGYAGPFRLRF